MPFEIPNSWAWTKFSQIVTFSMGKTPERHSKRFWDNGVYPWFSIADMKERQTVFTTKERISAVALKENFNDKLIPAETLIMSFKLTVGRTSVLGVDAVHNEAIISIFPFVTDRNIIRNFLLETLGLLVNFVNTTDAVKGSTLNSTKMSEMFIPLPPLAEQERIVRRVEELFAYIDTIDDNQAELEKLYDDLKKRVLDLAIQGKLVPQEPTDEPASVLLEKIRAEKKAKLGKKYVDSFIYKGDDNCYYEHIDGTTEDKLVEVPFDPPNGWCWCKIKEFGDVLGGKRIPAGRKLLDENNGHIYIKVSDMKNGSVNTDKLQYVPDDIFMSISRYIIKKEDIYITVAGTIGQVGIIPAELDGANLTENADRIVFRRLNQKWLLKCLESNVVQTQIIAATTKVGQPKLAIARIQEFLIPLPPLAEQQRIVDKINEIFANL